LGITPGPSLFRAFPSTEGKEVIMKGVYGVICVAVLNLIWANEFFGRRIDKS